MFTSMLPILPPPSTSLLPSLHTPRNDAQPDTHIHTNPQLQQQRRTKHLHHPRSNVHLLTLDERAITQRKMAIAMYGYSWLKPAGCNKTMLGRREEELEKEEAERQLREVEMQERLAAEGEAEAEAERLAEMRRLELEAEAGGVEGMPEERDLDDDIPEAEEGSEEGLASGDNAGEEDMEADLDDDIPDADAESDAETSWAYDVSRDIDSALESDVHNHNIQPHPSGSQAFTGTREVAETEAMVNAMLDEDELGELESHRQNLTMDTDMDMDMDMDLDGGAHNLDDDIPSAESEGEWQHTDTELDESEMDISMLPGAQQPHMADGSARSHRCSLGSTSRGIGPGTTHEEIRRVSGNIMMPPPPVNAPSHPHAQSQSQAQAQPTSNQQRTWLQHRNITPQARNNTPMDTATNNSVSNLISSSSSSLSSLDTMDRPGFTDGRSRNWLTSAAGARRNLFGSLTRRNGSNDGSGTGSGFTPDPPRGNSLSQPAHPQIQTGAGQPAASSGGLFTPSPRVTSADSQSNGNGNEEPRSRTRSGRLLSHGRGRG